MEKTKVVVVMNLCLPLLLLPMCARRACNHRNLFSCKFLANFICFREMDDRHSLDDAVSLRHEFTNQIDEAVKLAENSSNNQFSKSWTSGRLERFDCGRIR